MLNKKSQLFVEFLFAYWWIILIIVVCVVIFFIVSKSKITDKNIESYCTLKGGELVDYHVFNDSVRIVCRLCADEISMVSKNILYDEAKN